MRIDRTRIGVMHSSGVQRGHARGRELSSLRPAPANHIDRPGHPFLRLSLQSSRRGGRVRPSCSSSSRSSPQPAAKGFKRRSLSRRAARSSLALIITSSRGATQSVYLMRPIYLAIAGYLISSLGEQRVAFETRVRDLESRSQRLAIARSLHDGFIQSLAAVKPRLETCKQWLSEGLCAHMVSHQRPGEHRGLPHDASGDGTPSTPLGQSQRQASSGRSQGGGSIHQLRRRT